MLWINLSQILIWFLYQHGFQDLDGHIWELIHMEPSAINQG
jgi:predicted lactoylglutathione lyase